MADTKQPPVSFDAMIQEGRKKRKAEQLAAEIFGKNRRSSAPALAPKAALGASLASRVGVSKRPASLTRTHSPRQTPRPAPAVRPAPRPAPEAPRPRPSYTQSYSAAPDVATRSNGVEVGGAETTNGAGGISFKGAASGPWTVVAQNFAPGTTAADIESVMQSVGGDMTGCRLAASSPTVIAEMTFVEKSGAEKVIETFNGKKADGRPLYVYWKANGGARDIPAEPRSKQSEPQAAALGADQTEDVAMEVDEIAEEREAQDRLREERRGRDDRGSRDVFPTGPRSQRDDRDSYYRGRDRRADGYQDGRYGFGGGYGSGRGRYNRGEERQMGRGMSWRP